MYLCRSKGVRTRIEAAEDFENKCATRSSTPKSYLRFKKLSKRKESDYAQRADTDGQARLE
jgi:hypothetical protein